MTKKKILFVTGNFYPDVTGGAVVTKTLADEMVARGHTVLAFSSRAENNQPVKEFVDGIRIFRGKHNVASRTPFYPVALFRKFIFSNRAVPKQLKLWETEKRTADRLLPSLEDILSRERPDVVISVCYPIHTHMMCAMLRKKYSFEWFAYYLDSFFNHKQYMGKTMRLLLQLEKHLLRKASHVYISAFFANDYGFHPIDKKRLVIKHPLITSRENSPLDNRQPNAASSFYYVGSFHKDSCNPRDMLLFFSEVAKQIPLTLHCVGKHYGLDTPDFEPYLRQMHGTLYLEGPVEPNLAVELMEHADFLVSIGNSNLNQLPSKVIRYINTGKPIIHFYKNPHCPAKMVLERYPMVFFVDEASYVTDATIADCLSFVQRSLGKTVPKKQIKASFSEYTAESVANAFLEDNP